MRDSAHDFYAVLGVPRSASPSSIRRAYRQRALSTHPDKGGSVGQFRLVVSAFETLGSVLQRQKYDRLIAPTESLLATGADDKGRAKSKACPASTDSGRAAGAAKCHAGPVRKRSATPGSRQNLHTPARSRSRSLRQGRRGDAQDSSQTRASSGSQGGRSPMNATDSTNTTRSARGTREAQLRSALDKLCRLLQLVDGTLRRSLLEDFPVELRRALLVLKQRQQRKQQQQQHEQQQHQQQQREQQQHEEHQQQPRQRPKPSETITDVALAKAHEQADMSDDESQDSSSGNSSVSAGDALLALQDVVPPRRQPLTDNGVGDTSPAKERRFMLEEGCPDPQHHAPDDPDPCKASEAASQKGIFALNRRSGVLCYIVCVVLHGVRITSGVQHTLEAAVNAHVVLLQVRDAVREAFKSRRVCLDGIGMESEAEVSAREVASIAQSVFAEHGIGGDSCFCTYGYGLSLRPFARTQLNTPTTRSLQVCLMDRHRLRAAHKVGWQALREAWLDLVTNVKERMPGARGRFNRNRSRESAAAYLDAAYEKYCETGALRLERQARRVANRAHGLLQAMARAREARKRRTRLANVRKANQRLRRYFRSELTMDDLLRGPCCD